MDARKRMAPNSKVRLFQAERAWEVYNFVVMLVFEVAMVILFP